jgi:hypothetical protein
MGHPSKAGRFDAQDKGIVPPKASSEPTTRGSFDQTFCAAG